LYQRLGKETLVQTQRRKLMELKEIFIQKFKDFTPEQIIMIARAMGACKQVDEYSTCSSIDEMLEQVGMEHLLWFMRPYLYGADLREADLHGANLRGANLRDTDLHRADLRDADLRGADLREADLHRADLRNADLRGADLRDADLRDTTLHGADLREADLREADLRGEVGLSAEQREYAALRGAIL
jgi:uncharacterized protein YjbI with pentapeptide repeats